MVKGVVHDILFDEKIYVTKDSEIKIIPVDVIARKIPLMFKDYEHRGEEFKKIVNSI